MRDRVQVAVCAYEHGIVRPGHGALRRGVVKPDPSATRRCQIQPFLAASNCAPGSLLTGGCITPYEGVRHLMKQDERELPAERHQFQDRRVVRCSVADALRRPMYESAKDSRWPQVSQIFTFCCVN